MKCADPTWMCPQGRNPDNNEAVLFLRDSAEKKGGEYGVAHIGRNGFRSKPCVIGALQWRDHVTVASGDRNSIETDVAIEKEGKITYRGVQRGWPVRVHVWALQGTYYDEKRRGQSKCTKKQAREDEGAKRKGRRERGSKGVPCKR